MRRVTSFDTTNRKPTLSASFNAPPPRDPAKISSADSTSGSRYVTFGRRISSIARTSLVARVFEGFLMIDHINMSSVITWVLAYHYVPVVAVLLGIMTNCGLQEMHTLFLPMMLSDSRLAGKVFTVVLPHLAFAFSTLIVGYKLMGVVADAMIDSVKTVRDERSGSFILYYALLQDLLCISRDRKRVLVFLGFLSVVLYGLFGKIFPMILEGYEPVVRHTVMGVFAVGLSQALFGVFHMMKQRDHLEEIFTMWWHKTLPRWRNRGFIFMTMCSFFWMFDNGATFGFACWLEANLYLQLPHMVLCVVTKLTKFALKVGEDIEWLSCNLHHTPTFLVMMMPWAVISFSAAVMCFKMEVILTTMIPASLLLHGITKRLQDETPHKSNMASTFLLLYTLNRSAFSKSPLQRKRRSSKDDLSAPSPHESDSTTVRVFIRAFGLSSFFLTFFLGLGIVFQSSSWYTKEKSISAHYVNNNTAHINVQAVTLNATLQGLSEPVDGPAATGPLRELRWDTAELPFNGLCSRRFQGGVNMGDLAYFSFLAYFEKNADFDTLLEFFRVYRKGMSDWEVAHVHRSDLQNGNHLVFYEFHSRSNNASIIAIRGTDPSAFSDLLQNVGMYLEAVIFSLLAFFLPGSSMIPESVIVDFVYLASRVERFAQDVWAPSDHERRHYWMPVYQHAARISRTTNVIAVTGHSLGGSLAMIVGARLKIPGVGFSSPGVVLSRKKFGVERRALDAFATNVITSNDIIPQIDRQAGTIYNLQCEYYRGDLCHSIELHLMRIVSMCADVRATMQVNATISIKAQLHERILKYFGLDWGEEIIEGGK